MKRSFTLSSPFQLSRCVLRSTKHSFGSPWSYHLRAAARGAGSTPLQPLPCQLAPRARARPATAPVAGAAGSGLGAVGPPWGFDQREAGGRRACLLARVQTADMI